MDRVTAAVDTALSEEENSKSYPLEDVITIFPADGSPSSPTMSVASHSTMKKKDDMPDTSSTGKTKLDSEKPQGEEKPTSDPQNDSKKSSSATKDKSKAKNGIKLSLFNVQPVVRDDHNRITLTWLANEIPMSQTAVQEYLEKRKADAFPTLLDAYQAMSPYEQETIRIWLDHFNNSALISVKRSYTDLTHRAINFNHVPILQFVLAHDLDGDSLIRLPKPGAADPMRDAEWSRPTYIKVHRKHLDPETLNIYELPWEVDKSDPNFLIIKQYINEKDQEILFAHTSRLHEVRHFKEMKAELLKMERDKGEKRNSNGHVLSEEGTKKQHIFLKDPLNRTLVLPFELCDTMDGLVQLLHDAFSPFKVLEALVLAGEYDLQTLKGGTILPRAWKYVVEPGMEIMMRWREREEEGGEVVEVAEDEGMGVEKDGAEDGGERCEEGVVVDVEEGASE